MSKRVIKEGSCCSVFCGPVVGAERGGQPMPLFDALQVVAHNMEANYHMGLQMFAQALPQMRETRELLEGLLACEFVGLANFSQVGGWALGGGAGLLVHSTGQLLTSMAGS